MKNSTKTSKKKPILERKLKKVLATPASFALFVAIHDFVEAIEIDVTISKKLSKDLKYGHLKQIHRGVKDMKLKSKEDLGHERYMIINDLNKIQNEDLSESNSFWKKRELFRKLAMEIYDRLNPPPVVVKK